MRWSLDFAFAELRVRCAAGASALIALLPELAGGQAVIAVALAALAP